MCSASLTFNNVMSFSANEDRKYIHDVVCKVQVVKFEPKSGLCLCMRACVCVFLCMRVSVCVVCLSVWCVCV